MSRRYLPLLVACLVLAPLAARAAEEKADRKKLDAKIDQALDAYNAGDAKKFWADYAKSVQSIATPQAFKALYVDGFMKSHGKVKVKERKFLEKESILTGDDLLLQYEAEFDKVKKGKIAVNMVKEDGDYKFVQILFGEAK
jgi:hypothetical protein